MRGVVERRGGGSPTCPFQRRLLVRLYVHAGGEVRSGVSRFLKICKVGRSMCVILAALFTTRDRYLSPSRVDRGLRFAEAGVAHVASFLRGAKCMGEASDERSHHTGGVDLASRNVFFVRELALTRDVCLGRV